MTNEDFAAFLNARGNEKVEGVLWMELKSRYAMVAEKEGQYAAQEGFERHPAVEVSWHGAPAFCAWAGKRMPDFREWRRYPWGDTYELGLANAYGDKDGFVRTAPVGSFPKGVSPSGVLDMAGNVWEWA